jgi:hypothetical protein
MIYLALLFIKHYLADFVLQTDDMVRGKAIYGNLDGINHSLVHVNFTLWISYALTLNATLALVLSLIDGIIHYHVDWAKMNFGCRDITNKLFWNHLGLDQLAHALTYIGLASYVATLG